MSRIAIVDYPAEQVYILNLLIPLLSPHFTVLTGKDQLAENQTPDLQWSDYDAIEWDYVANAGSGKHLVNSYVIRKSLIRKNHLAHSLHLFRSKNPKSILHSATLQTFHFALSFPDELDELLQDDLYELSESFENPDAAKWWILKPALADKGNGIRLFSSREELEAIFEEFEDDSEEEYEEEDDRETDETGSVPAGESKSDTRLLHDTKVSSSQLSEWVIQEYVSKPLLLDPSPSTSAEPCPKKFHLRVYTLAVGGLSVYVNEPYLALFAPTSYDLPPPSTSTSDQLDLSSHLTNTCLQTSLNAGESLEIAVRTLQGMSESIILSGPYKGQSLGESRISRIEEKVGDVIAETFKAGLGSGSGFQVLPNCFELFGIDLLVDEDLNVFLLEINACPDFTQTGTELESVVHNLFADTIKVAVLPYFAASGSERRYIDGGDTTLVDAALDKVGLGDKKGLRKVLDLQVSRAW